MTKQNLPMDCAPSHELPADLIHNLRTPLNHIIGYAELLIAQAQDTGLEGQVPDLEIIRKAGEQLLTLMSDNLYALSETKAAKAAATRSTEQATKVANGVATKALLDYAQV